MNLYLLKIIIKSEKFDPSYDCDKTSYNILYKIDSIFEIKKDSIDFEDEDRVFKYGYSSIWNPIKSNNMDLIVDLDFKFDFSGEKCNDYYQLGIIRSFLREMKINSII